WLSFYAVSDAITGGREAEAHSRPYMASLQVADGCKMKHECGGFLVTDQWVMSAAHCFLSGSEGRKVVLGAHSLKDPEDSKQTFDIVEVFSHPNFSISNYDNDIALVKLDRPIVASDAVKSLKFQSDSEADPVTDQEVNTAGWGSLNNLGSRPDKLQELVIAVMNRVKCGRSDYYGIKFTKNMLCAAKTRSDTCDVSLPHNNPNMSTSSIYINMSTSSIYINMSTFTIYINMSTFAIYINMSTSS
uniref:trypsin n=1 Tax=Hucho hucho TaxID=62062 RepID=A0A4W5JR24_9TELE